MNILEAADLHEQCPDDTNECPIQERAEKVRYAVVEHLLVKLFVDALRYRMQH